MVQKFEAKDLSLPTKESDYSNFDQEPDSQIYGFQIKKFTFLKNSKILEFMLNFGL